MDIVLCVVISLYDGPVLCIGTFRYIRRYDVDADDGACGYLCDSAADAFKSWMDMVGDVMCISSCREIRVAEQIDELFAFGNSIQCVSVPVFKVCFECGRDFDLGEYGDGAILASFMRFILLFDEIVYSCGSVSSDRSRHSHQPCNDFIPHYHDSMVIPFDEFLDDGGGSEFPCFLYCFVEMSVFEDNRDPFAASSIGWFDDERISDSRLDHLVVYRIVDPQDICCRVGDAIILQNLIGIWFVLC